MIVRTTQGLDRRKSHCDGRVKNYSVDDLFALRWAFSLTVTGNAVKEGSLWCREQRNRSLTAAYKVQRINVDFRAVHRSTVCSVPFRHRNCAKLYAKLHRRFNDEPVLLSSLRFDREGRTTSIVHTYSNVRLEVRQLFTTLKIFRSLDIFPVFEYFSDFFGVNPKWQSETQTVSITMVKYSRLIFTR